jgi:hypothetical protein
MRGTPIFPILPEPPSFTLLYCLEAPPVGGDTIWANQYMAFETLSAGLQETLLGLRAVHSAGSAYGTGGYLDGVKHLMSTPIEPSKDAYREQVHPAVIAHPETGRSALYLNPVYTARICRVDKSGIARAAAAYLSARGEREFHLAPALGERHACDLGQPLDAALCDERLSRISPRDGAHERQRQPSPNARRELANCDHTDSIRWGQSAPIFVRCRRRRAAPRHVSDRDRTEADSASRCRGLPIYGRKRVMLWRQISAGRDFDLLGTDAAGQDLHQKSGRYYGSLAKKPMFDTVPRSVRTRLTQTSKTVPNWRMAKPGKGWTGGKFLTECCWRATLGWETGEHMFTVGAIIVFDSLWNGDCWE